MLMEDAGRRKIKDPRRKIEESNSNGRLISRIGILPSGNASESVVRKKSCFLLSLIDNTSIVQEMNNKQHIIEQLKPHYFWDVDLSKLSDTANKRLIIERVIKLGTLREIDLIVTHYGRSEVIKVVQKINFDLKTLNFISKLFKIPKNDFTCYIRKPLKSQHWNL